MWKNKHLFLLSFVVVASVLAAGEIAINPVDPTNWLQQCYRTFTDNCCVSDTDAHLKYSNHLLIEKPSGLCTDHLFCAFKECSSKGSDKISSLEVNDETTYDDVKDVFDTLNLPSKIAFPTKPKDAIFAIRYAKANNLKVSIKATSHSYTGSSTVGGSLQLNLRDFSRYTDEGVVECTDSNLENACRLAKARGKHAYLKIGGGQTWSDAYLEVMKHAETTAGNKYDIVGGGAGSVGAAGGWLQGGGWSHGAERMYGLGIDQILEVEMVLADESYVRFGPTEWEDVDGYLYPKTTKVEGECYIELENDEKHEGGSWGPCPSTKEEPPFEDLWFAVRGGGGGSFGLVTAVKYQLHERKSFAVIYRNDEAYGAYWNKSASGTLGNMIKLWLFFVIDLLYRPETLGIDKETSSKCGHPAIQLNVHYSPVGLMCYDNVWSDFLEEKWKERVDAESSLSVGNDDLKQFWVSVPYDSFPHAVLDFLKSDFYPDGKIPDSPTPNWGPDKGYGGWCSAVIPDWWLADSNNDDDIFELFNQRGAEHVTGGFMEYAHDQMTSLPASQRRSGLSSPSLVGVDEGLQNRLLDAILKYDDGDGDNEEGFPGVTEINHVCIGSYGPLKSDNSKICPENYSIDQKERDCMSMHESIWGTKVLARLQDIKFRVDQDTLFDCNICIQPKAKDEDDGSSPSEDEEGTSPSEDKEGTSSSKDEVGESSSSIQKYIHNMLCLAMVVVSSLLSI